MSYHNTPAQSTTNNQEKIAPPGFHYMPDGSLMADDEMDSTLPTQGVAPTGFHYMPDGSLMSDADHLSTHGIETLTSVAFDLLPIKAAGETREFSISGSKNAEFYLEIINEDSYYYNFTTKLFQAGVARLNVKLTEESTYKNSIVFPVVTDDDHYDIYLFAKPGTKHADHKEVRFKDGTMDINNSIGSNSLLLRKIIYQYLDVTLIVSPFSTSGGIEVGSVVSDTTVSHRSSAVSKKSFSISCAVTTAAKCYRIIKQPTPSDVIAFVSADIGAAPIPISTENIYPAISDTDTLDGTVPGNDDNVRIVMDNNVATNLVLGDKITAATSTSTVDGAVSSGVNVQMDHNVTTKMAVGDQITAPSVEFDPNIPNLSNRVVKVAALSVDGDNTVFAMSEEIELEDGLALVFSPFCNRSLTTVAALNPDSDNAKEFSMSQNVGFVDGVTLSFSNQMNYRWPINNQAHIIQKGMVSSGGTGVVAGSVISDYQSTITNYANTPDENVIILEEFSAVDTLGVPPAYTNGEVTTQSGAIVFNQQQPIALVGQGIKIGGYGEREALRVSGYEVVFTDLAIALTPITTTTTSAVNNSTSVPVASRNGILDDVSTVSGIGIDADVADPTVDTGAGAVTGAGTLVLTAAQTLEDGVTLTFPGAGQVATITGNIEIKRVGKTTQTLRFDVDRLLSIT